MAITPTTQTQDTNVFAEAARRVASGVGAGYNATADFLGNAGDAVGEAYRQATGSLDKPGPDFTPQPFSAGEIADTGSGVARVLANMMASRRDIANYKEAQANKEAAKAKADLEVQRLKQQVASGATRPFKIGDQTYNLTESAAATVAARMAGKSGAGTGAGDIGGKNVPVRLSEVKDLTPGQELPASWVPDPNDPTKGLINEKELANLQQSRGFAATERNRGAVAGAVGQRIDLAQQSAGYARELAAVDAEEANAGTTAKTAAQSQVAADMKFLSLDHAPKMTSVQFEAKRKEIAGKYGLQPDIASDGSIATIESDFYLNPKNEDPKVRGGGWFGLGARRPTMTVYNMSSSANQAALNRYIDNASNAAVTTYRNRPDVVLKRQQLKQANDANLLQQGILQVASENEIAVNPQPGNNGPRGTQFTGASQTQAQPRPNSPAPAAPVDSTSTRAGVGTQRAGAGTPTPAVADSVARTMAIVNQWANEDAGRTGSGGRRPGTRTQPRKR